MNGAFAVAFESLDKFLNGQVETQFVGEQIFGAAGDGQEEFAGAFETVDNFAEGAVSACGEDEGV